MKFLLSVIALCLLMIKAQQRILVLEKELIHKKKSSKVIGITRKSPNTNHKQLRNGRVILKRYSLKTLSYNIIFF